MLSMKVMRHFRWVTGISLATPNNGTLVQNKFIRCASTRQLEVAISTFNAWYSFNSEKLTLSNTSMNKLITVVL